MRRVVVIALLALALPMAVWADNITLTNQGGTISISDSGIASKGSQLKSFNGIQAPPGKSLGSVSYTTGALTSGSIAAGGTFSSAGSTFDVIGKGNFGQPKGPIFTGGFTGDIAWTLVSQTGQKLVYTLSGDLSGQLYNGVIVTGQTTQTITTHPGQLAKGIGHITLGTTTLTTPEPGTLGLLGTGLLGIAGMFRRKRS
ncbi:MAG TPA: PEP-CTERM sorting domain-containing protein [Terriglobales bacterium]|nr:PEP-CTERM sorting domain-containing protein [Terriglobales bacterium]